MYSIFVPEIFLHLHRDKLLNVRLDHRSKVTGNQCSVMFCVNL